jgi:hypothetical protein
MNINQPSSSGQIPISLQIAAMINKKANEGKLPLVKMDMPQTNTTVLKGGKKRRHPKQTKRSTHSKKKRMTRRN